VPRLAPLLGESLSPSSCSAQTVTDHPYLPFMPRRFSYRSLPMPAAMRMRELSPPPLWCAPLGTTPPHLASHPVPPASRDSTQLAQHGPLALLAVRGEWRWLVHVNSWFQHPICVLEPRGSPFRYYCSSASSSATQYTCGPGQFSYAGASSCLFCATGYYGASVARTTPTCDGLCSPGRYGSSTGQSSPLCTLLLSAWFF
jgi:hypothetical protein